MLVGPAAAHWQNCCVWRINNDGALFIVTCFQCFEQQPLMLIPVKTLPPHPRCRCSALVHAAAHQCGCEAKQLSLS